MRLRPRAWVWGEIVAKVNGDRQIGLEVVIDVGFVRLGLIQFESTGGGSRG